MTEEQKKFKILKKTSYEEQVSKEDKKATMDTFLIGLNAAAAIIVSIYAMQSKDIPARLAFGLQGFLLSGVSAYHLKNLIQAIGKKTILQSKIEDIDTEIDFEESRGMIK